MKTLIWHLTDNRKRWYFDPRKRTQLDCCPDCIWHPTLDRHVRWTCTGISVRQRPKFLPFYPTTKMQNVCRRPISKHWAPKMHDPTACQQRPNELDNCKRKKFSKKKPKNPPQQKKRTRRTTSCGHHRMRSKAFVNRVKSKDFVRTWHDLLTFAPPYRQTHRKCW